MPFEVFEPERAARSRGVAMIRLGHGRKLFTLNAAAKAMIGETRHVRLLFDEEARRMALEPTTADDQYGYSVGQVPSGGNIHAKAFATQYGLGSGHRWELRQEGDLFVADVNAERLDYRVPDEE